MRIVADDKIPYLEQPLRAMGFDLRVMPGRDISNADVRDADILVVRTRTRCDRTLLEGTRVGLVLTATIGYDHLDTAYLDAAGIAWANCPGCNATSVAQYVGSALICLHQDFGLDLHRTTLAIIGVGHVGTAVLHAAETLGISHILLNDPPRQQAGHPAPQGYAWSTLGDTLRQADVVTLHTPLTTRPPHPTHHLINATTLALMPQDSTLISAARGEVADEQALTAAIDSGHIAHAIIDTWEHEPAISTELLRRAYIATPHIAGYSADGKANATRMVLTHICRHAGTPMTCTIEPPPLPPSIVPEADNMRRALQLYDPRTDSRRLKADPQAFEALRGAYPLRREHF